MIIYGDCLEEMRKMEPNSISAIVTDPPYGISFMGKDWDTDVPTILHWHLAYKVLKPGGYLLAMGGTRTYHRVATALEDAGFEIRDCLMWIYGSGFPKSHNISKGADKKRNDDVRPICRFLRAEIEKTTWTIKKIAHHFGFHPRMVEHWAARDSDSQPSLPTNNQWLSLKNILGFSDEMDKEVFSMNERKGQWGEAAIERGVTEVGGNIGWFCGRQLSENPISDIAKKFDGYGTALKPAYEPIIMAMKPVSGTFVKNAEKWGQAGINIDGCRIGDEEIKTQEKVKGESFTHLGKGEGFNGCPETIHKGRWPANVLFDEEAAKMLDEQSDGASRFFYCAKACKSERNLGCEHLPVRGLAGSNKWTDVDYRTRENGERIKRTGANNNHPTVKPLKLMEYLIKLIMPPKDGVLLDPFAGSGTTILAAQRLGYKAIGIEKEQEYCEIARARLECISELIGKA